MGEDDEGGIVTNTPSNVVVSSRSVREVRAGFNVRHPRNTFAKIPRTPAGDLQCPGLRIDWSADGAVAFQRAAQKFCRNAAHVGPHDVRACSEKTPLLVLRAQ